MANTCGVHGDNYTVHTFYNPELVRIRRIRERDMGEPGEEHKKPDPKISFLLCSLLLITRSKKGKMRFGSIKFPTELATQ